MFCDTNIPGTRVESARQVIEMWFGSADRDLKQSSATSAAIRTILLDAPTAEITRLAYIARTVTKPTQFSKKLLVQYYAKLVRDVVEEPSGLALTDLSMSRVGELRYQAHYAYADLVAKAPPLDSIAAIVNAISTAIIANADFSAMVEPSVLSKLRTYTSLIEITPAPPSDTEAAIKLIRTVLAGGAADISADTVMDAINKYIVRGFKEVLLSVAGVSIDYTSVLYLAAAQTKSVDCSYSTIDQYFADLIIRVSKLDNCNEVDPTYKEFVYQEQFFIRWINIHITGYMNTDDPVRVAARAMINRTVNSSLTDELWTWLYAIAEGDPLNVITNRSMHADAARAYDLVTSLKSELITLVGVSQYRKLMGLSLTQLSVVLSDVVDGVTDDIVV